MKVFAWVRVSDRRQQYGISQEVQVATIERMCAMDGHEIARVFVEQETAFHSRARRRFQEMCDALERAEFKDVGGVVFYDTSRFTRNRSDYAFLAEQIRNGQGVKLLSAQDRFPEGIAGDLVRDVRVSVAWYQSAEQSKRVIERMRAWAEQGYYQHKPPLGYKPGPRDFRGQRGVASAPSDHAPAVRRVFEHHVAGCYSLVETAAYALEQGLRRRGGKPLGAKDIQTILSNPFYTGKFKAFGQMYQGKHEPIIPSPLFDQVQEIMATRGHQKPIGKLQLFPLKGLLNCAHCGERLTAYRVRRSYGVYLYYQCYKRKTPECGYAFRQEQVFKDGAELVKEATAPLKRLAGLKAKVEIKLKALYEARRSSVATLDKERMDIHQRQQKAMEHYLDGKIPDELWGTASEKWKTRLKEIEQDTQRLNHAARVSPAQVQRAVELIQHLDRVYLQVGELERARILKSLTSNILVGVGILKPNYVSPFAEMVKTGGIVLGAPKGI